VRVRRILIGLAVLVIAVVLLIFFGRPPSGSRGVDTRIGMLVVPGFVPDDARLIEVTKAGSETVRVRKNGADWSVESAWGYPADAARVGSLLQAIEQLRVQDVRSTRPSSHPSFAVDESAGIWVRIYDSAGKELANVCAGKSVSYNRCFVRAGGSHEVAEVTPNLLQNMGAANPNRTPSPTFFVNKSVVHFTADDVRTITLDRDAGRAVLERTTVEEQSVDPDTGEEVTRQATKWMVREPHEEEADADACRSIVNAFANMMAVDIGGGKMPAECGLAPAKAKVTIGFGEASEQEPVVVLLGEAAPEAKGHYVIAAEEGARIFIVSSTYWDLAVKDLDQLRKVKPEVPPGETGDNGEDPGSVDSEAEEAPPSVPE